MKSISLSLKKRLFAYYLLLLGLCFFIMRPNVFISMPIRVVLLVLCLIPVLFNKRILPFVIVCFYGISSSSFVQAFPTSSYIYLFIVSIFYVYYSHKTQFVVKAVMVIAYFFMVSLFHLSIEDFLYWLLIVVMISDMVVDIEDLQFLFYAILIVSAFLSIQFLFYADEFLVQYGRAADDMTRSAWTNPNQLSAVIGTGAVLCFAYLSNSIDIGIKNLFLDIVSILVLVLSFVVITLNGSRGAFLAVAITAVSLLSLSKTKLWVKIVFIIVIFLVVIWMLRNNVFELMMARMNEDSLETGGGRLSIWRRKFNLFFMEDNPLYFLFGIGRSACNELGGMISTHNDFVTSFIGYGIVGLIIFVYSVVLYPIKKSCKEKKKTIVCLLLFVIIECSVVEPFFRGLVCIMMYYIFILKYALIKIDNINEKRINNYR